ncbi:MAG: hypothetical protein ACLRZZ_04120, partial [Enterocloster sp.]
MPFGPDISVFGRARHDQRAERGHEPEIWLSVSDVEEPTGPYIRPWSCASGPCDEVIDPPGVDDEGQLGSLRVRKSYQVLNKTDVAVLVMDVCHGPAGGLCLLEKIGKNSSLRGGLQQGGFGRNFGRDRRISLTRFSRLSVGAHTGAVLIKAWKVVLTPAMRNG